MQAPKSLIFAVFLFYMALMGLATFSTYSTYLMPVFMVISGVYSYFMYKKGWLGKASDK